jgi:hypothetical protein
MQALSLTESLNPVKSSTKTFISIPIPIPIPRTESKDLELNFGDQYSLKANIFDPSKMSPPNNWKCRLEQRIKEQEHEQEQEHKHNKSKSSYQIGFIIEDNE